MMATMAKPRVSIRTVGPSVAITHRNANAPVNMLKTAPTSNPSITPMPTARPASAAFTVQLRMEGLTRAATANRFIAQARGHSAKPQHAAENAMVLRAVANPPSAQTQGRNLNC